MGFNSGFKGLSGISKEFVATSCLKNRYIHRYAVVYTSFVIIGQVKIKGKAHPCTGTETLYRSYGP